MVNACSVTYWACEECSAEYDTEEEAENCCKEGVESEEED